MKIFDLQCGNGHNFEGWFDDKDAFEDQKKAGYILCPICETNDVLMIPSTFAIPKTRYRVQPETSKNLALGEVGKKISEFVESNFDDVGAEFTKEALKIHYGVSKPRNIRGVSSPEEEKLLEKEGVPLLKVPLPEKSDKEDES